MVTGQDGAELPLERCGYPTAMDQRFSRAQVGMWTKGLRANHLLIIPTCRTSLKSINDLTRVSLWLHRRRSLSDCLTSASPSGLSKPHHWYLLILPNKDRLKIKFWNCKWDELQRSYPLLTLRRPLPDAIGTRRSSLIVFRRSPIELRLVTTTRDTANPGYHQEKGKPYSTHHLAILCD